MPFVFNVAACGRVYPAAFLAASRLDAMALRRSEDAFVDELFARSPISARRCWRRAFPRAYLDLNREPYELDPRMFDGRLPPFANTRSMRVAGGLGTIPRIVADGQEIYRAPTARRRGAAPDRMALQALSPGAEPSRSPHGRRRSARPS